MLANVKVWKTLAYLNNGHQTELSSVQNYFIIIKYVKKKISETSVTSFSNIFHLLRFF